jgi:GMP synthase-like glutamine amidotransferase
MSVHDTHRHPWIAQEITAIERHLAAGTPVVGVCLGAQLIAVALGARVSKAAQKEIGFWPVEFVTKAPGGPGSRGRRAAGAPGTARPRSGHPAASGPDALIAGDRWQTTLDAFPARPTVFHWHGETFDLPAGAVNRARTAVCEHQMFTWGERAAGLQFHLEATPASVEALATACADEIGAGLYEPRFGAGVARQLGWEARDHCGATNNLMAQILHECCRHQPPI